MASVPGVGPRGVPYRVVNTSEIPEEWSRPTPPEARIRVSKTQGIPLSQLDRYIAIEVPDIPLFWQYHQWLVTGPFASTLNTDIVPVVIVNRQDFIRQRGQDAFRQTLVSLIDTGRPALLWLHLWAKRPA